MEESIRVPFYLADLYMGIGFLISFGISLVYAKRERVLVKHFTTVRSLFTNASIVSIHGPRHSPSSMLYFHGYSSSGVFYGEAGYTFYECCNLWFCMDWGDVWSCDHGGVVILLIACGACDEHIDITLL
jgi:hypothetical protein